MNDNVIQLKGLANTKTATWPDEFVKIYLNNHLAGQELEDCIHKLDSVVVIKAQGTDKYLDKDIETNTSSISITDNIGLSQTANLPAILKLFSWPHPLIELNGICMCLVNLRSWNGHLEYFLSDKIYSTFLSLLCFTETNINDSPKYIDEILDDWKDIHRNTQHVLALYYNVSKGNIVEVSDISSVLAVLPIALEIEKWTSIGNNELYAQSSWYLH